MTKVFELLLHVVFCPVLFLATNDKEMQTFRESFPNVSKVSVSWDFD